MIGPASAAVGAGEWRPGLLRPTPGDLQRLLRAQPIDELYDVEPEPIASGQFACVRRCVARVSGRVCAAKYASRVRLGDDCSAELRHEVALLALCAPSPRIVRLHDVFETPKELVMVLEYAPGGDLQAVLDGNAVPFEEDAARFVRQLLEALVFLHERRVAHLDIKPQNLVLTDAFPRGDVKLCDFEVSRILSEGEELREILGTPDYVAPEILHYEPITLAADMWSLGVTAYALLTGFSPFGGETDQETFCNIARAQLDFPPELFEGVSDDATAFLRALLVREPSARPSAEESLRHPWLRRGEGSRPELRRFLSKSREALVERWAAGGAKGSGLRRGALLSQSQMSLSRSREKLYGLRSLSRSQDLVGPAMLPLPPLSGAGAGASPLLAAALARATAVAASSASQPDLARTAPASPFGSAASLVTAPLSPDLNGSAPPAPPAPAPAPAHGPQTRERASSEPGAAAVVTSPNAAAADPPNNQREADTHDGVPPPVDQQEDDDEEEPRFSVAQLISAFNRHQQLSTSATAAGEEGPGASPRKGPNALRSLILEMEADDRKPNGSASAAHPDSAAASPAPSPGDGAAPCWPGDAAELAASVTRRQVRRKSAAATGATPSGPTRRPRRP